MMIYIDIQQGHDDGQVRRTNLRCNLHGALDGVLDDPARDSSGRRHRGF